jgi:hypothetical protein
MVAFAQPYDAIEGEELDPAEEAVLLQARDMLDAGVYDQQVVKFLRDNGVKFDVEKGWDDQEGEGVLNALKIFSKDVGRLLYFMYSGVSLRARYRVLSTCPEAMGKSFEVYVPAVGDEDFMLMKELSSSLGSNIGDVASGVFHKIICMRLIRKVDPTYMLDDASMEYLRKALFMMDSMNMKEEWFCNFGKDLLSDLRNFVGEYEEVVRTGD